MKISSIYKNAKCKVQNSKQQAMKTKSKIITGIAITIMFSMMTTLIFAQNQDKQLHPMKANKEHASQPGAPAPPPPPPPPPPPLPAELYNQEAPVMPQLDLPDLSNDQREKIRLSDIEHLKTMTPLRNQVSEKKARLQTVLTTSPYDAKSSDLVVEELGKIETMIMKEMIRHDQALRNLLTPDQQVIFDSRLKPFLCKGK